MHADRSDDRVGLGVDHVHIIRSRIDHVDFILLAIDGDACRLAAYVQGLGQGESAHVDDADRIALAIGDVRVLAKSGPVVWEWLLTEVPPSETTKDGNEDGDE